MVSYKTSLHIILGLAAYVQAAPAGSASRNTNSSITFIKWGKCSSALSDLSELPVECAKYEVPLDYTDQSNNKTAMLSLIRVPATKQPSLGSILLNHGGPGIEAVFTTAGSSFLLNMLSGGQHDLVAFDPRGTGKTLPFKCFTSSFEQQRTLGGLSLAPQPDDREAIGHLWAAAGNFANACAQTQNETGSFISTAFAARDIVSVATALGEKDKVCFWGFSYGTTLGATLVSMFPEKIERVVLDGVQNPHEYYHADADFEEWVQSDEVFSAIFEHCVKNADRCTLARRGNSSAGLEKSFWSLYERLRYDPLPVGNAILNHFALNEIASRALYSPESWPDFTKGVNMLLGPKKDYDERFLTTWTAGSRITNENITRYNQQIVQSLNGIHCSDRVNRLASLEEYLPVQQRLGNISRVMSTAAAPIAMACAQWKFDAKERYKGDFQVAPRNPVLLVGNSFDGHTPIASARNVSSGFKGSAVLEVSGYGHLSLNIPSKCAAQKYAAYWVNGTMPKSGSVCEAEYKPWSNVTWKTVAKEIGWPVPGNKEDAGSPAAVSRMPRVKF